MIRGVLTYPAIGLKQVATPISPHGVTAKQLAADLIDTLRSFPGCVGLAAPQIGELRRAIVIDVTGHRKTRSCNGLQVLFNPDIISASGSEVAREGCLSLPDFTANVRRATQVTVRALGPGGEEILLHSDAFEARVLLHEIDHLDGYLFLDRVTSLKHDVFRRKVYQ